MSRSGNTYVSDEDIALEELFWSRILPGIIIVFVGMIAVLAHRQCKRRTDEDEYWDKRRAELESWERELKAQAMRKSVQEGWGLGTVSYAGDKRS